MDLSKLTLGSKVVIGAGVLLLIDSFLHWQEVTVGPFTAGVTMWHGWGVLIGLVLLAILAWEAAQIADMKFAIGSLSPSMLTILLSALLLLFTLIKVLSNDFVAVWAWIGLVLAAAVAVGAWLNMKEAGESFGDLTASVSSSASSATAAARSATGSGSAAPAPAAPAAPAEPPPAEPEPGSDTEPPA